MMISNFSKGTEICWANSVVLQQTDRIKIRRNLNQDLDFLQRDRNLLIGPATSQWFSVITGDNPFQNPFTPPVRYTVEMTLKYEFGADL